MLVLCLALVQCQKTYSAIPPWSLSPGLIFLFSRKTALTYCSNDNVIHSANKLLNLRFITCTSVVETLRKLSGWILSAWGWILLPGPDSFPRATQKMHKVMRNKLIDEIDCTQITLSNLTYNSF